MPRKPTGSVVWSVDHFKTRIRFTDGSRPWVHLRKGLAKGEALTEAAQLQELATAGQLVREDEQAPRGETVAEWFERWLAHRKERGLTSHADDVGRFRNHIKPVIGHIEMTKVTSLHVERIVQRLDELILLRDESLDDGLSAKTARNVWGIVTKAFDDAVRSKNRSLRCLEHSPCEKVAPPERRSQRARQYLYPDELLRLLSCDEVPLSRRRCYALGAYLGTRKGELSALTVGAVDIQGRFVHVHEAADRRQKGAVKHTKTSNKRKVPIEQSLVPLLAAMIEGHERNSRFVPVYERDSMAEPLREDLERAGINREELHIETRTTARLTFHDLRASCATWWTIRGDDVAKIEYRLGHDSRQSTRRYIREAEVYRERFGEPFPPLPECLLVSDRLDHCLDQATPKILENTEKTEATPTGLEPVIADNTSSFLGVSEKSTPKITPSKGVFGPTFGPNENTPADVLTLALAEATKAQRWDVVAQIAQELDARRLDASNVTNTKPRRGSDGNG